jgi:hypothetical protein
MTKLNEQQKQIALKAYMVGPARCQEEAIYAAVEAVLDQQAGALTDDQILSAMKVLNEDARCCLTRENWKDGIDITLPTHNARKFVAEIRALAQRSPEPAPVCPHCGPVCYGGAAHNARKEDGVIYAPAWTQADEDKARKVEFDAIDAPAPQSNDGDVVERMLKAAGWWLSGRQVKGMTEALAEARRGISSLHLDCPFTGFKFSFHTQEQVDMLQNHFEALAERGMYSDAEIEKAILEQGNTEGGWPEFAKAVLARLSAHEQPSKNEPVL